MIHCMQSVCALRASAMITSQEPKPEAEKPKEKKPDVPQVREKLHGSGAHSRESKTPKAKQKAVYGKPKN